MKNNKVDILLGDYIKLRVLVGYLGEKEQFGWWDTSFLSPTGRQFLAINFPRAPLNAGSTAVSEAARRVHDARIGRIGAFHLFRLPPSIEESLHEQHYVWDPEFETDWLVSDETAMNRLKEYFSDPVESSEGPVQVGKVARILTNSAIAECARHYFGAFDKGTQSYPYFSAAEPTKICSFPLSMIEITPRLHRVV